MFAIQKEFQKENYYLFTPPIVWGKTQYNSAIS